MCVSQAKIRYSAVLCVLMLSGAAPTRPASAIDFDTQIIPVLTRAGCNAGACHGSAAGRGEFKLSLFGGDAAADYFAVVRQFEGRRINLAHPRESLLIGKPTGQLDHGGGLRLEEDGPGAQRLFEWITAGAPPGGARRLDRLDVTPARTIVGQMGSAIRLRATAHFSDGVTEDVTPLVVFAATDPSAVTIAPDGQTATIVRRGQHVVIARFLDRVVPLTFVLPVGDEPPDFSAVPRANFIDEEILASLATLRLAAAPRAGDAEFLRRVSLDLTGRLPSRVDAEAFLADGAPDKRLRLVERLLAGDAFVDYWAFRLASLLRIRTLPNDRQGAKTYTSWIREQIGGGVGLDEMARQLLTATGDSHAVGPANFARMTPDARAQAELVSQAFLGVRIGCANCHNHPLDRWTQDDYHGLAAIYARLDRGRIVAIAPRGAVTNPRSGEPAIPRIPGVGDLAAGADGRIEFANWLTAPDNHQFARAIVNRLWQAMFGRGLVEPVDDLRETNPPTHPDLLDRLAEDFISHGYDLRHTLRLIALSETYGRSEDVPLAATVPSAAGDRRTETFVDGRFYSRATSRPLAAEVLADMIADVSDVPDHYGGEPLGTRAITLFDPQTPAESLDVLGRCSRAETCEEPAAAGGLPAKLHLLNGPLVNRKVAAPEGVLHRRILAGWSNEQIVADFYWRALSRPPSTGELSFWSRQLAELEPAERRARLEDFVWCLLNCREFATNH
jgi:hypothetical protein